MKKIDTADLCEIAHMITAEICKAKKIKIDCSKCKDKKIKHYSMKAQNIFNKYFDLLDNTFRN